MPLPKITVKKFKDGREVARFRDTQGLVRTRVGITGAEWSRAETVKQWAEYGIQLQKEQALAGLGSSGSPMPPLKGSGKSVFLARKNGKAHFGRRTYGQLKSSLGLKPIRDLYGPGKDGHMLDAIRMNYLDDRKATFTISSKKQRDKARGNERRAPWWGWSPANARKMREKAAELFGSGPAERLFELGLIGASALAFVKARYLRRAA